MARAEEGLMTERSTHLFQAPDPRQTVAGLVLEHSACAAVLQRHRIDFCCGGELSIAEAAEKRGVELDALLHELGRTIAERQSVEDVSLRELPTAELVEHIVARHHDTLRKSLPFVQGLAAKVSRVHGGTNPKLRELDDAVQELSEILLAHLDEEEQELFPALTTEPLDEARIRRLLGSMTGDHTDIAVLLERIRAASDDFSLPHWACTSYRTLFSELWELEADIFIHVHLENHVLKPRFVRSPA
jgi:regulator of cell morphogenesis and NO signaling